jgi:uracil permease
MKKREGRNLPKTFLGYTGKDVALSLQHTFAMFGATVTVPIVIGMSIPLALLSAGVSTIIFYFVTQRKVPVFLGSSFAYMPGLLVVFSQTNIELYGKDTVSLAAMIALACAGFVYVCFSGIIKLVGVKRIRKLFPPIVVGPVIIIIGMNLAGSIFWNDIIANYAVYGSEPWKEWTTAIITALTIILVNAFAKPKSFLRVIPILMGFLVGYVYGMCIGLVNFDPSSSNFLFAETMKGNIVIFQQAKELWGFWGAWSTLNGGLVATALLCIVPIAIVTFMEHIGEIGANSTVCGKDFMVDPGLHRTILGDGLSTMVSAMLGGPENTTYGENTAVLAMTKNYNPRNIFLAACFAILLAIFVPVGEFIKGIPTAVVGGACVVLFGMIASNGLRALIDAKVDFANNKNMIVVSVTLSVGLGLGALSLAASVLESFGYEGSNLLKIGFPVSGGGYVEISPLAIATVLAILLNAVVPDKKEPTEEEMEAAEKAPVTLQSDTVDIDEIIGEKETAKSNAASEVSDNAQKAADAETAEEKE